MNLLKNIELKKYSYIRIGGPAKYFATPKTIEELINLIKWSREMEIPLYFIGSASNILFDDEGYEGIIIRLTGFNKIDIDEEKLTVKAGAGVQLPFLVQQLSRQGLSGLEQLCEIPGTVGGAIAMNAGAFGREIGEVFEKGLVVNEDGKIIEVSQIEFNFGYRKSELKKLGVLIEATFKLTPSEPEKIKNCIEEYKQLRREKQPVGELTLGSVFKNPESTSAGYLLESAGLKGFSLGNVKYSEKHANFIVNMGNASANEYKNLMQLGRNKVKEKFGIILEPEIILLAKRTDFFREVN